MASVLGKALLPDSHHDLEPAGSVVGREQAPAGFLTAWPW